MGRSGTIYVISMLPVNLDGTLEKMTGMDACLIREFVTSSQNNMNLVLFAPGGKSEQKSFNGGRFITIEQTSFDHHRIWFDRDWALLHPEGYLSTILGSSLSNSMFETELSCPADLHQFYRKRFQNPSVPPSEKALVKAMSDALMNEYNTGVIPDVVYWLDFSWSLLETTLGQGAFFPTSRHVYQSHLCMPPSLGSSQEGERILTCMALCDEVEFHTDADCEAFTNQLHHMGLRCPLTSTFTAGVDSSLIEVSLDDKQAIELAHRSITHEESATLLHDIFESRTEVPHRFVSLDRLDVGKGTHTLVSAVHQFLDSQPEGLTELQKKYRFYFLMDYYFHQSSPAVEQPNEIYISEVQRHINALLTAYPGVVFVGENIPNRSVVGALLRNCHYLSGTSQESLGLAPQEALLVNAFLGNGCSAIVSLGSGIGKILQSKLPGSKYPILVSAGDVSAIVSGIYDLINRDVSEQRRHETLTCVERVLRPRMESSTLFNSKSRRDLFK